MGTCTRQVSDVLTHIENSNRKDQKCLKEKAARPKGEKNERTNLFESFYDACLQIISMLSCPCGIGNISWRDTFLSGLPLGKIKVSALNLEHMTIAIKVAANNGVYLEVPFGKPIEEVYDGIHDSYVLGTGLTGVVRMCKHKKSGVAYAVKCLDVGKVTNDKGLIQIRDEIYIMSELDHPNIVRLKEVYLSNDKIYLIMEVCQGGDLFDRLNEQPNNHYTEQQCAILVNQMLKAVRYIHSKGIVHRDLKLENFLFSTRAPDSQLKLIDFGISKHFSGSLKESVGTPYTVAPEVILGKYDERCDMWSIGVLTYLLLSGETPFGGCDDESLEAVRNRILSGSLVFEPKHVWSNVSQQGKEFVRKLLVTDPNDRLFAREAQKSEWLKQWAVKGKEPRNSLLNPGVVKSLASFKEHSVVQKLLCRLVSYTLLPDQIEDLRIEFEKLDTDDLGEITLDDLKTVLFEMAEMGAVSLNEAEVEDICNAMLIQRSGNKIRWHDFIAAGLSYCKVDYRNLQLAFDKLDKENKGYMVFYDIAGLAGSDADESMKALAEVIQCRKPIIIYEKLSRNFKVITKLETGRIIVQDENSRY